MPHDCAFLQEGAHLCNSRSASFIGAPTFIRRTNEAFLPGARFLLRHMADGHFQICLTCRYFAAPVSATTAALCKAADVRSDRDQMRQRRKVRDRGETDPRAPLISRRAALGNYTALGRCASLWTRRMFLLRQRRSRELAVGGKRKSTGRK